MRRLVFPAVFATVVLCTGAVVGSLTAAPLLVVYNPSLSMPIGWYLRVPLEPGIGRIVVIDPPLGAQVAGWPSDVKLIKPIAGVGGDHVCVASRTDVLVNGKPVVPVAPYPAPRWEGCRTLEPDELFLIAPHRADSVDSRIYGPVSRRDVLGTFIPLWTENEQ